MRFSPSGVDESVFLSRSKYLMKKISENFGEEIIISDKLKKLINNLYIKYFNFWLEFQTSEQIELPEEIKEEFNKSGYYIQRRPFTHINHIRNKIITGLQNGTIILFQDFDEDDNIIILEKSNDDIISESESFIRRIFSIFK